MTYPQKNDRWELFYSASSVVKPCYSIVVPFYDDFESFKTLISSICLQTFCNFEVVVVDDMSPNREIRFRKFLETWPEDFSLSIIFMSQKSNGSICRNVGCDLSKGDFIAFLDADDYWQSEKLEVMNNLIKNNQREAVFYHKYRLLIDDHFVQERPLEPIVEHQTYEDYSIVCSNHIQCSTLVVPRSVMQNIRFDENLPRHQDLTFIIELRRAGYDFIFENQSLSDYRYDSRKLQQKLRLGIITPQFFLNWRNQYLTPKTIAYNIYTLTVVARAFQLKGQYIRCLEFCIKSIRMSSLPYMFRHISRFITSRRNSFN